MAHFSEEAWTDFIRGTSTLEANGEVEAHLATGCADCETASEIWNRLRIAAVNERTYAPPEELVRRLKLEFSLNRMTAPQASQAIAVFDTLLQPLPAGFRSGSAIPRQLLYEGEGLTVDLRLEHATHSRMISAMGQVLDKKTPHIPLNQGSITLWTTRGLPILETNPNSQGEFELEFEAEENLHLCIALLGRNPLRIILPQLQVL
jgi:hypothetical protein